MEFVLFLFVYFLFSGHGIILPFVYIMSMLLHKHFQSPSIPSRCVYSGLYLLCPFLYVCFLLVYLSLSWNSAVGVTIDYGLDN
jgi:hypothetical protein